MSKNNIDANNERVLKDMEDIILGNNNNSNNDGGGDDNNAQIRRGGRGDALPGSLAMNKVAEHSRGHDENKEDDDEAGKDNECEQEAGAVEVNSICEKLLSSARDAAKEIEQRLQPRLLRIMDTAVSTDHAKRDLYKTKRITTIQQQITELEESMEQMKTVLQHLQSL